MLLRLLWRLALGNRGLDGVLPFGFAGDDVGVEVEKKGLAGAILGLVEDGKIKLPPMRERQERRVAERYAFAKASLEPAEEAVEAAIGSDAKGNKGLLRVLRGVAKIDLITARWLAESHKRFAGSAHQVISLQKPLDKRPVIEIVES